MEGLTKPCRKCGQVKELDQFSALRTMTDGHHSWCKACRAEHSARVRQAHPEREREAGRRYHAKPEVKLADRASYRRWYASNRTRVLSHYGQACACCGSEDRLTIDHVAGDGAAHRAQLGGGGGRIYAWLVREGFPDGFQTLCRPCNASKSEGPACRLVHAS